MAFSADRWQRLQALFHAALALEPDARSAFLDQNCGSDGELRRELKALLEASEKPLDGLRQPVLDAAHPFFPFEISRRIPTPIFLDSPWLMRSSPN